MVEDDDDAQRQIARADAETLNCLSLAAGLAAAPKAHTPARNRRMKQKRDSKSVGVIFRISNQSHAVVPR